MLSHLWETGGLYTRGLPYDTPKGAGGLIATAEESPFLPRGVAGLFPIRAGACGICLEKLIFPR
jgi:hypothetical protein